MELLNESIPSKVLVFLCLICQQLVSGDYYCNEKLLEKPNYALSVNGSLNGSTITLTCFGPEIPAASNQYLKWTEMGKELPTSTDTRYTVIGGTVTIVNATDADYGVYSCRCFNNFTVSEVEDIFYALDHKYSHHCSELYSVTIVPPAVSVINHIVEVKNTVVEINCSNETDSSGQNLIDEPPLLITVDSSSKQGKYICTNESDHLKEIHYIMIKDYEPATFLIPNAMYNSTELSKTPGDFPLCAVYSSFPLTHFSFSIYYGVPSSPYSDERENSGVVGFQYISIGTSLLEILPPITSLTCSLTTEWDSMTINSNKFSISDTNFEPTVCLSIAVDPSPSDITVGRSFTVYCLVYSLGDISASSIDLLYTDTSGDQKQLRLNEIDYHGHDYHNYSHVVSNVTENSTGEYSCRFKLGDSTKSASLEIDTIQPQIDIKIMPEGRQTEVVTSSLPFVVTTATLSFSSPSSSFIDSTATVLLSAQSNVSPSSSMAVTSQQQSSIHPMLYGVIASCSVIVMGVIIGVFVTVIIACHHKRWQKKVRPVNVENIEDFSKEDLNKEELDGISVLSLRSLTSLVDDQPGNRISENMKKCIRELKFSDWYIPYEKMLVRGMLGSGAFGQVKRAQMYGVNNSTCISNVAVKMLKENPSEDDEKDIITELKILKNVGAHKNIVSLIGASVHNGKLLVIVEYCPGGNLMHYLRKKKQDKTAPPLTLAQQVDMGRQVACGMEYLSSKKCVHRDLAARNILLAEDGTLKVSDFGLARETYHSMYKMSTKGKIPFKWMAPESIFYRVYTTKSDVWSFGVLLWEIITFAWSPYPGKSVEEVVSDLQKQKLMKRPPMCPVSFFDVILKCWKFEPSERPAFSTLVKVLEDFDTDSVEMDYKEQDCNTHEEYDDPSPTAHGHKNGGNTSNRNHITSSNPSKNLMETAVAITSGSTNSIRPSSSNLPTCSTTTTLRHFSQDDYYDNEGSQEFGYISCESKGLSTISGSTEPMTTSAINTTDSSSRGVQQCNLCELELIKRSNSELGSASEVFTDSEADDSFSTKNSVALFGTEYNTYSHKSDSDSGMINDFNPFAIKISSDSDNNKNCIVLLKDGQQSQSHPGYLETVYNIGTPI